MKLRLLILCSFVAFFGFFSTPTRVHAATLTVCPSGAVGQNGCQYIGGEGIQQAVDAAQNGDTVFIKSGTYTNPNPRQFSKDYYDIFAFVLIENKQLHIQGEKGTLLDGSSSPIKTTGIVGNGNSILTIDSIAINNMRMEDKTYYGGDGLHFLENVKVTLTNSSMNNNEGVGITLGGDTKLVADTIEVIGAPKFGGLQMQGNVQAVVKNGLFAGTNGNGIALAGKSKLTGRNLTIVKNGVGVAIVNTPSLILTDTIISDTVGFRDKNNRGMTVTHPGYGIGSSNASPDNPWPLEDPSRLSVSHTLLWHIQNEYQCGAFQLCDFPGVLRTDPLFVDPANGDYHLQPNSPACTGGENGTYMGAFPCQTTPPPPSLTAPQCVGFNTYQGTDAVAGGGKALDPSASLSLDTIVTVKQANSDLEGTPNKQRICWSADRLTTAEYASGLSVFSCLYTCSQDKSLLNSVSFKDGNGQTVTRPIADFALNTLCNKESDGTMNGQASGKLENFIQALPPQIQTTARTNGLIFIQTAWDSGAGNGAIPYCTTNPANSESGSFWDGSEMQSSTCGQRLNPTGLSTAEANCTRRVQILDDGGDQHPPTNADGDFNHDSVVNEADLDLLVTALYTNNCDLSLNSNGSNCLVTIADFNTMIGLLRQ